MVHVASKGLVALELVAYLRETFPTENKRTISHHQCEQAHTISNKQKNMMEYARTQDLWKKDAGKCARRILEERMEQERELPQRIMEPYW